MAFLGFKGILALHVMAADAWLLFGDVSVIPFKIRSNWVLECLWLTISFLVSLVALPELCEAGQGWLGPATWGITDHSHHETPATAMFAGLTIVHFMSLPFASTSYRR